MILQQVQDENAITNHKHTLMNLSLLVVSVVEL
jgi:hypothetical protein